MTAESAATWRPAMAAEYRRRADVLRARRLMAALTGDRIGRLAIGFELADLALEARRVCGIHIPHPEEPRAHTH